MPGSNNRNGRKSDTSMDLSRGVAAVPEAPQGAKPQGHQRGLGGVSHGFIDVGSRQFAHAIGTTRPLYPIDQKSRR